MKGIVAEINKKYAIMLLEDGTFRKVKAMADMRVGEEIELNQSAISCKTVNIMSRASAIAAAVLFIFGIGCAVYGYTVPYTYIDLDINPSVEITANIFDRIIGVEALNDDGRKLMGNDTLRSYTLENGISEIISRACEQGYLKVYSDSIDMDTNVDMLSNSDDPMGGEAELRNTVLLTVSSAKASKCDSVQNDICKAASDRLKSKNIDSEVIVGSATIDQRDDAKKQGVSPGKLKLIQSVIEAEPDLKMDELKNSSVKELLNIAKACMVKDIDKANKGEKRNENAADAKINDAAVKGKEVDNSKTGDNDVKEKGNNKEDNNKGKKKGDKEDIKEDKQKDSQGSNQKDNRKNNLDDKQKDDKKGVNVSDNDKKNVKDNEVVKNKNNDINGNKDKSKKNFKSNNK